MKLKAWVFKGGLVMAAALVATCGTTRAQDNDNDGCSNRTLRGDYGFTIEGQILPPAPQATAIAGVSMMHFSGTGHLTQVDYLMRGGTVSPGSFNGNGFRDMQTGTYTVNSDCTGSITILFPADPANAVPASEIDLKIVLVDLGRQIKAVVSALKVFPPNDPQGISLPVAITAYAVKLGPLRRDEY